MATPAHSATEPSPLESRPALDRVTKAAHEAVDKAADAAAPSAEWLSEQADRLTSTQRTLVDDACSYVTAHPLKSLGLAVAAGFILSRMIR
jgi:ElaB/YqjD/DUF883 family membrane-anchored ribosome-binding protein